MSESQLVLNLPKNVYGNHAFHNVFCEFDRPLVSMRQYLKIWVPFNEYLPGLCLMPSDNNGKPLGIWEFTASGVSRRIGGKNYQCLQLTNMGDLNFKSTFPLFSISSLLVPSREFSSILQ